MGVVDGEGRIDCVDCMRALVGLEWSKRVWRLVEGEGHGGSGSESSGGSGSSGSSSNGKGGGWGTSQSTGEVRLRNGAANDWTRRQSLTHVRWT